MGISSLEFRSEVCNSAYTWTAVPSQTLPNKQSECTSSVNSYMTEESNDNPKVTQHRENKLYIIADLKVIF